MRSILVLLGLIAATLPAAASGGVWCHLEDRSVKLAVESGVTRGLGAPVFNFRGKLEELIIETQAANDEDLYRGSYKLAIFDSEGAAGEGKQTELGVEINCDAE